MRRISAKTEGNFEKRCHTQLLGVQDFSTEGILEHYSDDGEPGGTAGRPILGVLKSTI